jgi:multidrug efflux pump subunit AcrB
MRPGSWKGFNLSRWAISHGGLTAFLLVLLLVAGVISFLRIGQKEDADFTFRVMVVQVLWPGASVQEMQEQVVDKIERKLQEVPGLDFVRSYTRSGFANIFVNLKGSMRGEAVKDAWYQARKKVGDIRQTFPEGVIGPYFNDEFGDTYISLYAFAGRDFAYPELKAFAKNARDILLRIPGVAKVDLLGTQDERIFIEVSSAALAERGLSALDIQTALGGQNAMDPAGRVETTERSVRIDVQGGLRSIEDIRALRLRAGGTTFRLGDIAEVRRGLEDPPSAKTRYQGLEAVLLGTTMAPGANVTEVGAAVERTLKRIEQDLPIGVSLGRISDQAQVVTKSIREFLEAFGEAVGIVLIVALIALGWRAGLVVALTIPMVLAATALVMSLMGIDLHRISLGALIIALGLLVDDAMIAVEMMDRKLREGYDKLAAATFAYTSTAFPMLTGTLITVAGFIPVGFAQSSAGEYVSSLFWVTGVALMISWFAAVYFTPWIGYRLLKVQNHGAGNRDVFDSRPYRAIRALVAWCVRRPWPVVVLTFAALVGSIGSFSLVPKQFFPTSNRPEILVDLWLPEGSSFEEVGRSARRLEQKLLNNADLAYVATFVGEGAPRFFLPLDQQLRNPNFAQLMLMPKSIEARERVLVEVRETVARDFPNVRFKADRLFMGPPVGWPVQVRVIGPDRHEVLRLAAEVGEVMRATPNLGNVHNDWLEPVPTLKLEIDQDRARALGVTSQSVRRSLQAMLSGFQVGEFRDKDETIKVMLREPSDTRNLLSSLDNVYVKTADGASVPLRQVATFRVMLEPGIQWRRDRLPSITVRGVVPDGVQSPDVAKVVFAKLEPLRAGLSADYRVELQGAVEEWAKGQTSINEKMPVMFLVILLLLMVQLQHFGKTLVVLATARLV